jgi:hypothetical protein
MLLKILAIFSLIGSVFWCANKPDYEPAIAVITSLSAVVVLYVRKGKATVPKQTQNVSGRGVAFQAGGDINVRDVK